MERDAEPPNAQAGKTQQSAPPDEIVGKNCQTSCNPAKNEACRQSKHPLDWIVAGLLVLTFFATGFAAFYTRKQWLVARDQERRSLRAYAFATATTLQNFQQWIPTKAGVNIGIIGQTPAYNLHATVAVKVLPYPDIVEDDLAYGKTNPGSVAIVAPGAPVYFSAGLQSVTEDDWAIARVATIFRLYIWGHATYEDVFRQTHFINFCVSYGADGADPDIMSGPEICPIHNDVDIN